MEQKEFNEKLDAINFLISEAQPYREDTIKQLKMLPEAIKAILNNVQQRDSLFIKYLSDVSSFDYADTFTTPSDVFPGIRTAAKMADPEELQKKTEDMKDTANKVTLLAMNTETGATNATNALKRCLSALSEYMIQENQIYDRCMKLLNEMNSIYEIGQIASAT